MKKHFLLFSIVCELILVLFNMGNEDPVSIKGNSVQNGLNGHFEYVVEYPIWVFGG